MHDRVRTPSGILGFSLVALAAEWMGHALTWWATGGVGPGRALSGSTHAYLQPVGVSLALVAVALAALVALTLDRLVRQGASLRAGLARAWRLDGASAPTATDPPTAAHAGGVRRSPFRVAPVAAALLVVQLAVYLLQENLEVRATGLAWPGLHVLSAHHGSAVLAHAAVALLVAAVVVVVDRRWAARHRAVRRLLALHQVLAARRRRAAPPGGLPDRGWTPIWLLGSALLPRPPPGSLLL